MDRIWQWAWDRHGPRYSWVIWAFMVPALVLTYLVWTLVVVAFERSSHYLEVTVVTAVAVAMLAYVMVLPNSRPFRRMQSWAAGREVNRAAALEDTYIWTRAAGLRALWLTTFFGPHCFSWLPVQPRARAGRS